ncbi:hypothetical protein ACT7C1_11850 [Bacillus paranthracis]
MVVLKYVNPDIKIQIPNKTLIPTSINSIINTYLHAAQTPVAPVNSPANPTRACPPTRILSSQVDAWTRSFAASPKPPNALIYFLF